MSVEFTVWDASAAVIALNGDSRRRATSVVLMVVARVVREGWVRRHSCVDRRHQTGGSIKIDTGDEFSVRQLKMGAQSSYIWSY